LKDTTFFTAGYMLYLPGSGTTIDNKILVARVRTGINPISQKLFLVPKYQDF